MSELKVTKIDLTELSLDALEGVEASGGNWKRIGKYVYKIVGPKLKCQFSGSYAEGPNPFSGATKSGHCSACKHLDKMSGYWVCEASKRKEV